MTVLVLAQKRIRDLDREFKVFNQKALLTATLLVVMMLAVVAYIGSLYIIFQAGFVLRDQEKQLAKLEKDVRIKEIQASNMETNLAADTSGLVGMEKISSMRYLRTSSSEVSLK